MTWRTVQVWTSGWSDDENEGYLLLPLRCAAADGLSPGDENHFLLFRRSRLLWPLRDLSQSGPQPVRGQTAATGWTHLQGESPSTAHLCSDSPDSHTWWCWQPVYVCVCVSTGHRTWGQRSTFNLILRMILKPITAQITGRKWLADWSINCLWWSMINNFMNSLLKLTCSSGVIHF